MHRLVSRLIRTNELVRTFDLYYVTRSNRRKPAYRSHYISANNPSHDSSPNRRNFENVFCHIQSKLREQKHNHKRCRTCQYGSVLRWRREAIERIQSESVKSSNQYCIDTLCPKVLRSMKKLNIAKVFKNKII